MKSWYINEPFDLEKVISDENIKLNKYLSLSEEYFTNEDKTMTYVGQINKGNAWMGFGRVTSETFLYEGEVWSKGKFDGYGRIIQSDLVYIGYWKDGKYNGKGKLTKGNGTTQEGEFVNGVLKT
jgi:hypothetical protein